MTEKWTKQSIVDAYNSGRRDFSGENFSGLDLYGINLTGATMRGTILTDAYLKGAIIAGANLTGANLSGSYMRGTDMRGADLGWTDMREVTLTGANLTGANIDCSGWPLWCGSIGVKVDKKIAVQLAYHLCALDCDDPEYREARAKVLDFANQMHRPDVKRLE